MTPELTIEFIEDANWLGGSIYIDNLLAALSELPVGSRPKTRVQFLTSHRTPLAKRLMRHAVLNGQRHDLFADIVAPVRRIHRALVRRAPWMSRLSRSSAQELYFPAFDTTQTWRKDLYWIADFQPHYFPELFDARELSLRLQSFKEISRAKGVLLLSSHSALVDFRRFYPNAVVVPRIWSFCSSIEPGSAAACKEIIGKFSLPEKFVYVANQFWRHKDHATAFDALQLLRERGLDVPLVCTGLMNDRRDSGYFANLMETIDRYGLQRQIHLLGIIPRAEQVQLFRAAAAILQPSRFEGWSTVIEDAKALGRPIIASDISVHREQLTGVKNTTMFVATDAVSLANCITDLWPALQAGPDLEGESQAIARRNVWRLNSAQEFVAILAEAHALLGSA